MKKLLWISLRAPYKNATKAGSKTHYFYLEEFLKTGAYTIQLLSFCYEHERQSVQTSLANIEQLYPKIIPIIRNEIFRNILSSLSLPVSLVEYFYIKKCIFKELKQYQESAYFPDIIFLQWTEIVLLTKTIKKFFPNSIIVAIEEDVTFLKLFRKVSSTSGLKKLLFKVQAKMILKNEIQSLKQCDKVVLNNTKDFDLVQKYGISSDKCIITVPYFENHINIKRAPQNGKIIFWGAMDRPENIEAVKWFSAEIMPFLENMEFFIVGANPTTEVLNLQSDRIFVTGFVDNPNDFFSSCMCMVVPLKIGAGIKIKVLESMSAGIPVLTNSVGIEGIPAQDGVDYIHCETKDQYIYQLKKLTNSYDYVIQIGNNAKTFIKNNYDINISIISFLNAIGGLVK